MKWIKKGLLYPSSATTPVPIIYNSDTIRIYAGFRDHHGVGRIGYIDVDAHNPSIVRKVSKRPVLDVGKAGMFDDNGVILGDVIKHGKTLLMYYVGFQHVQNVKFLAFTGLAVSRDNGETFVRVSDTPIFDRAPHEYYCRAIHTAMKDGSRYKIWYAAGDAWQILGGKPYPKYSIYYTESKDGRTFTGARISCITASGNVYRIGRPRVYKTPEGYEMFYTMGTKDKKYVAGYATSPDGKKWRRQDKLIGIKPSVSGWDSKMLCYPALIRYRKTTYMFYNGNGFGDTGIGYAILAAE